MEPKIKLGIIGCGKHAQLHVLCLLENPKFQICGLCDIDAASIKSLFEFIDLDDVKVVSSNYKEFMEDSRLEAFIVVTNTTSHVEIARYAAEIGKPVLVEKPAGINLEQVDELINLALESKSIILPSFQYHTSNFFANIYSYSKNELEAVKFIEFSEYRDNFWLPWFYDSSKSGGAIVDKLIHAFELITTLYAPSKPIRVFASGNQNRFQEGSSITGMFDKKYTLDKNDTIDNAIIVIEFEDGKKANVNLVMYQNMPYQGVRMYLAGMNGNFCSVEHADTSDLILTHNFDGQIQEFNILDKSDVDYNGLSHPGAKAIHNVYFEAIISGKNTIFDWQNVRFAHQIAFAATESIQKGEIISIDHSSNPELNQKLAQNKIVEFKPQKFELVEHGSKWKNNIIKQNLINRILRRRKSKEKILRITKGDFRQLINRCLYKIDLQNFIFKNNLLVTIELPWVNIYLKIDESSLELVNSNNYSDISKVTVKITESGYIQLANGISLNRLYITKQLALSGDINVAREYQQLFVEIFKELRSKLQQ